MKSFLKIKVFFLIKSSTKTVLNDVLVNLAALVLDRLGFFDTKGLKI